MKGVNYYLIAVLDYYFASVAVGIWDGLDHGLRTIAAIGVIITTWYLIKKYRSEKELNDVKKKQIELENQTMEQELYEKIKKNL